MERPPPEFGLWGAAGIHGARFEHSKIRSWATLATAERRIIDPAGGVATVGRTGRTGRWLAGLIVLLLAAFSAAVTADWLAVQLSAVAAIDAIVVYCGARVETQARAAQAFDVSDTPWILGDVAAVPGHRMSRASGFCP